MMVKRVKGNLLDPNVRLAFVAIAISFLVNSVQLFIELETNKSFKVLVMWVGAFVYLSTGLYLFSKILKKRQSNV